MQLPLRSSPDFDGFAGSWRRWLGRDRGALLAVAKKTPVENQVNVFREAVNQPEDLGEACTAFEDDLIFQGRFCKEEFENPADPEVFLDDGGIHAESARRLSK